MRVVHFALTGTMVGGVERYLSTLLGQAPGPLEHALVFESGDTHPIAGPWPAVRAPWSAESHAPVRGLPRDIPDGVPVFHFPPHHSVLAGLRRPWAVFCHDHRWWCPSGTRFHARPGAGCDIRAGVVPCALRYHTLGCGSLRPAATVHGFARAEGARSVLRDAPIVLVASEYMRDEAVRHGAPAGRVHVIPLPVSPGGPATAPREPAEVLYASRLTPEKGPFVLLDAFARTRLPSRLVLAGGGIAARAVENAVRAHPRRSDIERTGDLTVEGVRLRMGAARVVVVPSVWPEPFGLVGAEALAEGRPVVASAIGGMRDWAREDLGVIAVPPGDPRRLAEALDRILAEQTWAERAATAGLGYVGTTHDPAAHTARLRAVLG